MRIALVSDVFFDREGPARLIARLREARSAGADLALLPEIPLNPWSPATPDPNPSDAEPAEGPRHRALVAAARDVRIGIVGGIILRDPGTGRRTNTAIVLDRDGTVVARYSKVHLPDEAGFHEPKHYDPGTDPPRLVKGFASRSAYRSVPTSIVRKAATCWRRRARRRF